MDVSEVAAHGLKFSVERNGVEIARAYLYILGNGLHMSRFGLLEDLYVHEKYREQGEATGLVQAVIARARAENCYKLIATSRDDGTRDAVHYWYSRLGFRAWGTEFRMDF